MALHGDSEFNNKTMEENKLNVIFKASSYPHLVSTHPFLLFLCGDFIKFWIFYKFVCSLLCLFGFYLLVNNLSMLVLFSCYLLLVWVSTWIYVWIYLLLSHIIFFHFSQWERLRAVMRPERGNFKVLMLEIL